MFRPDSPGRRSRAVIGGSLGLLLCVTLGACNRSVDSDDSEGTGSTSQTVLDEAAKAVEAQSTVPTEWEGPTEPVQVVKDLEITLMPCDARLIGCVIPLTAVEGIGADYGWTSKTLDPASDPNKANQQMQGAIAGGTDVIYMVGWDPLLLQPGLAAAEEADVPVILAEAGLSSPNPEADSGGKPWTTVDVSPDYQENGVAAANLIIHDSKGEGDALLLTSKEFRSTQLHINAAADRLKDCAGCSSETISISPANVGTTMADQVVTYVRAHPDLGYIYVGYDPMAAVLVPALEKAGLSKVKVIGILGLPQNIALVREGKQFGDVASDLYYTGYAMVDQTFRTLADQPLAEPHGENVPWYLVTEDNVPDSDDFTVPIDYAGEYKKIWQDQ